MPSRPGASVPRPSTLRTPRRSGGPRTTGRLLALAGLLLALPAARAVQAQSLHCGTAHWMTMAKEERTALKRRAASPGGAAAKPARTLETPNFLIRYALRGPNRVKTVPEDQPLLAALDSLYRDLPSGLSEEGADSLAYARLGSAGAPHPRYVLTLADFLERARGYYVDTLGMRSPTVRVPSFYYKAPPSPQGKYPIDVVNIGTAYPYYDNDQIYGLTFPAEEGGMLVENDFLYSSKLDPSGIPAGDSIRSFYQGKLLHNYAAEWEAGLKVTSFHEFYHSVQLAYTVNVGNHVWYETSATGMEERKAPEVDDYIQYLPAYFSQVETVSMFNLSGFALYGNAAYFLFLTKELGEGFDKAVWERLSANQDDLPDALRAAYAARGRTSIEVFSRYAAQLAYSGAAGPPPVTPFEDDLPIWPALSRDSLDLGRAPSLELPVQPPMTLRATRLRDARKSGKVLMLTDTAIQAVIFAPGGGADGPPGAPAFPRGLTVPLDSFARDRDSLLLILANGSHSRPASGEIRVQTSRLDTAVYAYPNPVPRNSGLAAFSRLRAAAIVQIYDERGNPVRRLSFTPETAFWSWDLADEGGRKAPPGVYYYRTEGRDLQTLYVSP